MNNMLSSKTPSKQGDDDGDQGITGDARLWEGRQLGRGQEQQLWKVFILMMRMMVVMVVMVVVIMMMIMTISGTSRALTTVEASQEDGSRLLELLPILP